jgi:TetR/AcrR family transcriptional regulator, mexJK operon transcriptional repressor
MNTYPLGLAVKGRKVAQVLKGAQQVFMSEGYEGANVDAIARAAKVSKATLYSYFPDKRALFAAVAQAACQEQTRRSLSFAGGDGSFRERLYKGCRSFMEFLYSPFGLQMYRAVVAESARFPEFGRQFWATGPGMAHAELVALFRQAEADGHLTPIDDHQLAAETLAELCKVHLHSRLLLGVIEKAEPDELDRIARNAVDTFMARHGA